MQELRETELYKIPGVSETLDWTAALVALNQTELDPQVIDDTMGIMLKYQGRHRDGAWRAGPHDVGTFQEPGAQAGQTRWRRWLATQTGTATSSGACYFFGEVLRKMGLDVGSGNMLDMVRAIEYAPFGRKQDFRQARPLHPGAPETGPPPVR